MVEARRAATPPLRTPQSIANAALLNFVSSFYGYSLDTFYGYFLDIDDLLASTG